MERVLPLLRLQLTAWRRVVESGSGYVDTQAISTFGQNLKRTQAILDPACHHCTNSLPLEQFPAQLWQRDLCDGQQMDIALVLQSCARSGHVCRYDGWRQARLACLIHRGG